MQDRLEALAASAPIIWEGFMITMKLTVGGGLLAFILAIVLGLMARVENIFIRGTARVIIEFFRGTSLVVQLFWVYYVLPVLLGVKLDSIVVGVLALGFNYGAYAAEVVRGSINSVPTGQWEATTALSLGRFQTVFRVIFPQAWALMLPSLANLLIQLLKGTAAVSFIAMTDLTWATSKLRVETDTFFAYTVGLLIYFALAYVLTLFMNALEIRAKHRLGQGRPLREILAFKRVGSAREAGVA